MKTMRVLILNGGADPGMAQRLEDLLRQGAASRDASIADEILSLTVGIPKPSDGHLSAWLHERAPHLILLCAAKGCRQETEAILSEVCDGFPRRLVLLAASGMEPEDLCRLMERGATDFIVEPFSQVDLAARLLRMRREAQFSEDTPNPPPLNLPHLLGRDLGWRREVERIPLLAGCSANVLILGETGTGKELCARAIHQLGARRDRPFTPLNCGAIPGELVENELFGHTCGAYTGAVSSATGIVQSADGGTLFLDEVDSLPLGAQVKLLRFLQSKEYRQVGGVRMLRADVRIVAASNVDLANAVRVGRFRSDLFYRLNVMTLRLPPLRSRMDDIPLLARHFMGRFGEEHGKKLNGLTSAALQRLLLHDWPGNIRELENVIERAVIVAHDTRIQGNDISLTEVSATEEQVSFKVQKARAVAAFEKAYLQQVLVAHDGNISRAARAAQKNRRAFWELIRKHHLRAAPVSAHERIPSEPLGPDR